MAKRWQIPTRTTLIGEFTAELTSDEANQWEEYIVSHPEFVRLRECAANRSVLHSVVAGGALDREPELRKATDEYVATNDCLYHIAKAWYADLVAKQPAGSEV